MIDLPAQYSFNAPFQYNAAQVMIIPNYLDEEKAYNRIPAGKFVFMEIKCQNGLFLVLVDNENYFNIHLNENKTIFKLGSE